MFRAHDLDALYIEDTYTKSMLNRRRAEFILTRGLARLRWMLFLPALIGLTVVLWQVFSTTPVPALIVAGSLCCVPLLVTFTVRL